MKRDELLQLQQQLCAEAYTLMERKNHDYAGAGTDNPLANFEVVEALGITDTARGILTRMADKFMRMTNFTVSGKFEVQSESAADTTRDLINYAVIWYAFMKKSGRV